LVVAIVLRVDFYEKRIRLHLSQEENYPDSFRGRSKKTKLPEQRPTLALNAVLFSDVSREQIRAFAQRLMQPSTAASATFHG